MCTRLDSGQWPTFLDSGRDRLKDGALEGSLLCLLSLVYLLNSGSYSAITSVHRPRSFSKTSRSEGPTRDNVAEGSVYHDHMIRRFVKEHSGMVMGPLNELMSSAKK